MEAADTNMVIMQEQEAPLKEEEQGQDEGSTCKKPTQTQESTEAEAFNPPNFMVGDKHLGTILYLISVVWFSVAVMVFWNGPFLEDGAPQSLGMDLRSHRLLLLWGIVPFGLLNGIKHSIFVGSISAYDEARFPMSVGGIFFEREAGGANFMYAVGALQAGLMSPSPAAYSIVYSACAVYFFVAFFAWLDAPLPPKRKALTMFGFVCLVAIFVCMAFSAASLPQP